MSPRSIVTLCNEEFNSKSLKGVLLRIPMNAANAYSTQN